MQQGDRVRIVHHEVSFYQRLHGYNQLSWTPRMATYIGKVGIVTDVTTESVQVTFFSWGQTEANAAFNTNGKSGAQGAGRNTIVEATYSWHPKAILTTQCVYIMDGDRAILIKNKDLNKAAMVSVRIIDEDTLTLRLPHAESFNWKQSENPDDVILPIYTGRKLSTLMRDRNRPTQLMSKNALSPARIIFGMIANEPDPNDMMKALRYWADNGDEKHFRLVLHYHPTLVKFFFIKLSTSLPNLRLDKIPKISGNLNYLQHPNTHKTPKIAFLSKKNALIDGRSPLMVAANLGLWTAVVILLCIGGKQQITDPDGNSLYHIAAMKGQEQIIESLIILSVDGINDQNFNGRTPLHCAILNNNLSCIDRFLNSPNIDPNIQDNDGNTPLHIISAMDNKPTRGAMLHRLLSTVKVDQLVINNDGLTPLQLAIVANQQKIVQSMIRMKPTLLVSDGSHSLLPLHLAAAYGHASVLETILKQYPDVKKTTRAGRTALHFAVERWDDKADKNMQRLSCIQLLVSWGVPLNTRDCHGMTALHLAAQATKGQETITNNKVKAALQMKKSNVRLEELASALRPQWPVAVVCFLIAQGADPEICDRSGCLPFELVCEPVLKSLFKEYAACRPRSCVPMSSSVARCFDTTSVMMCTFTCDDNMADITFIPCGHRVVCATCAASTLLRRCPLCYQQIIAAKNSYGEEVKIGENILKHGECGDVVTGKNVKVMDDAEIQKIAEEAAECARKAAQEENDEIVRELRGKLEQLELEVTCAICMDQRCTIVFQCGHTACADCSNPSRLKVCHICRQAIKRRTTIYT